MALQSLDLEPIARDWQHALRAAPGIECVVPSLGPLLDPHVVRLETR